jgi:hypothetical protein
MVPYLDEFGQIHGTEIRSPISTNFKASDIDDFNKYATMITNKSRKRFFHELSTFIMLLIALIVRSTTQKDEKAFPHPQGYRFDIKIAW